MRIVFLCQQPTSQSKSFHRHLWSTHELFLNTQKVTTDLTCSDFAPCASKLATTKVSRDNCLDQARQQTWRFRDCCHRGSRRDPVAKVLHVNFHKRCGRMPYGCVRLTLPSQRSVKTSVTDGAKIGFASSGDPG